MMNLVLPYKPRPAQVALHQAAKRFNVFVIHRRFGKTVWAVNHIIDGVLACQHPNPIGAYIAPNFNQAKRIAWQYLKEYCAPLPGLEVNNSELTVRFCNGHKIMMLGSEKADALRGLYLDTAVLDETAQINPIAWSQVIRPALSDRLGSASFIGTPKGRNNLFSDLYHDAPAMGDDWARCLLTYQDTSILDLDEIEALRREMTEDEFNQEFMCSWNAAIQGAYWGKEVNQAEDDGRIDTFDIDTNYPVHCAWDLGWRNMMVCWFFQVIGNRMIFVDMLDSNFTSLPDFIQEVKKKAYNLGDVIFPHDIRKHELGSGQSGIEIAANHGIHGQICPSISLADGIRAVQASIPRMCFDRVKCRQGIDAIRQYRSKYNPLERVYSKEPLHDWCSDYADALRMAVVFMDGGQRQLQLDHGANRYAAIDRATI